MQRKQPAIKKPGSSDIAEAFVEARLRGQAITAYPGAMPQSLEEAYLIQDAAIGLWPDAISGWKVGRIVGADEQRLGVDRLAGPIFKSSIRTAQSDAPIPVFKNGFAAVEGEVVIILGADAPVGKSDWTTQEAAALIHSIAAGVEIASSPFSGINESGPLVTISDFGNNFGLIIGQEIPDWREFKYDAWQCETFIDGISVGKDSPANIPGGPIESLRFLLTISAERGLPLKKGMAVSTGAITGVHEVVAGQRARVQFVGVDPIRCELTKFTPVDPENIKHRQTA